MKSIGQSIRKRRNELGISLRRLEELSGVSFSLISKIEGGQDCSTITLEKIFKPLKIKIKIEEVE